MLFRSFDSSIFPTDVYMHGPIIDNSSKIILDTAVYWDKFDFPKLYDKISKYITQCKQYYNK